MKTNKVNYTFEREDEVSFKVWCVKNRLKIKEVAAKLNITYQHLNSVLKGKTNASEKLVKKLAQLGFKVEVE